MRVIRTNRLARPGVRREPARQVLEHIGVPAPVDAGHDDAGLVGILAARDRRIDRHNHAL